MLKYLFLTSEFVPNADASGICVYNVSRELIKNGNKVIVICEGKKNIHRFYEDIEIYELEPTMFKLLKIKAGKTKSKKDFFILSAFKVLRRIGKAFTLFMFPNVSPKRAKKEYMLLEKIHKKEKLDIVVGGFRPSESIEALTKFKSKYKNVKTIAVYWDLVRSQNPFGKKLFPLMDKLCYHYEKKVFNINSKILIPHSGEETYKNKRFGFAKEKIFYFDFPVFTDALPEINNEHNSNEGINLTCIGTIDGKNRSAVYFLELLETLSKQSPQKINVHIIGNFTDLKTYNEYKDKSFVKFYGAVDYDSVPLYIQKSDFLVNLGNKETYDMIPSKIFQYFSSCKPIINFVAHKGDKSLRYFNKYSEVLNIKEYEKNKENDISELKKYIACTEFSIPDFENVKELFKTNRPEYFADKFLR